MRPSQDKVCVYAGEVMHRRLLDTGYRFRYRVFSLLLDVDEIDSAADAAWCFSRNRFNLLSFHDADHLPPDARSLRGWAEQVLRDGGVDVAPARIRLLCFPRVLGVVFNPLSLWYCENADGTPLAVIAEVRNTFGERHCYLLHASQPGWPLRARHAKHFHVSPFIGMRAEYAFELDRPATSLRVSIREFRDDALLLIATQHGERLPFTAAVLLRQMLRVPLQTLKVVGAIHWHALKIWLRGTPFHRKPHAPIEEVS